ncbi:MAG: hypothetical protein RL584_798 [Pseudomonadota bacterium]
MTVWGCVDLLRGDAPRGADTRSFRDNWGIVSPDPMPLVEPIRKDERRTRLNRFSRGVVALLLLNACLSFSTWWPTPWVVLDARIAPEFIGLWVLIFGLVAWRGGIGAAGLRVLALAYLLLVLGRYADVTVPALFGRPINAYWDLPQIPRFLWVSAQEWPWWWTAVVLAAFTTLLLGLYAALRWGIGVAASVVAPAARTRPWAWLLSLAAVGVAAANYAGVQATWPYVSKPVVPVALRQAQVLWGAWSQARQAVILPPSSAVDDAMSQAPGLALAALAGADVVLMPLESLGAITYDDPQMSAVLQPARQRFEQDLRAGGFHVVSGFLKSPTFAGGSDLAHLSLLSGIDLSNPLRHDVLLTTQRDTLVTLFRAQGYQTFGVYPGVFWDWPERAFYRFDVYVDGPALRYEGPPMGFWRIPDQFSAAQLDVLFPRDAKAKPRFTFFPTITTHLPFSPVPPFQPDWQRVLSADPFDDADVQRIRAERPNWTHMRPDYVRMVEYSYRWLGALLRDRPGRETFYIFVGDHQPAASVTGEGASWDVPVYLVSRQERLLQRFVMLGYQPGVEPRREALGGLHDLTDHVLQVFSAQGPGVRSTRLARNSP